MSQRGLPSLVEVPLAAGLLLLTAPLLVVAGLAVRLSSPGPIFFRQRRVGRNGRPFDLVKFRTMRAGEAGPEVTAAGDPRVTAAGRWLRSTKVDELPSLWNVVRGEMALVGPRPEVPSLVDAESPAWQRVLAAKPGLTDPVAIELRNEEALLASVADDRDRFYSDVLQPYKLLGYIAYLERRTALSDLRVLWNTVLAVLVPAKFPPPTTDQVRQRVQAEGDRLRQR